MAWSILRKLKPYYYYVLTASIGVIFAINVCMIMIVYGH